MEMSEDDINSTKNKLLNQIEKKSTSLNLFPAKFMKRAIHERFPVSPGVNRLRQNCHTKTKDAISPYYIASEIELHSDNKEDNICGILPLYVKKGYRFVYTKDRKIVTSTLQAFKPVMFRSLSRHAYLKNEICDKIDVHKGIRFKDFEEYNDKLSSNYKSLKTLPILVYLFIVKKDLESKCVDNGTDKSLLAVNEVVSIFKERYI